jgi:replication factor C subunit 1
MKPTDLWINKYCPKNINQVIGNSNEINQFKKWITSINSHKNQSIIISGNQGIGKTLIIKLILEEFNYIVKIINPNEIKDHRCYDDLNDYYNFSMNSIYAKINFNNNQNKKIAIVFDETENITLTSEKKYIMDVYKENNKYKCFPLIFISNNQHSKLLYDLKKGCDEIIFKLPNNNELILLINNIIKNENIIINDNNIYDKIISFSQYDIRRLINILQELSFHIIDNIINNDIVDEFIEKSRYKNISIGLFDATFNILNNYLEYDKIIKLYESEKVLLPLMIQENYIKKMLSKSKNNINDIIDNIVNISDSISIGDNIETSIYTDQNWYLQNIHGFFTCVNTSYWINKYENKYTISHNDIKFSADLNKTSLKNINRKNINNLSKIITNKSIEEILMLNRICNSILDNPHKSSNQNLINILNGYKNISIKDIELCLKIDKTIQYNTLSTKDKKSIIKLIN